MQTAVIVEKKAELAMKLIYTNGNFNDHSRSFRVFHMKGRWYVIAPGLLCQVETYQEGIRLVEKLKRPQQDSQGPQP